MVLSTFNRELYKKNLKEDAYYEGAQRKLHQQIKIKLAKGKNADEIADDLEEDVETIQTFIKELRENPEKL